MDRENCRLDQYAGHHEAETDRHDGRLRHGRDPLGEIDHVQRPGDGIDEADTDNIEGGADRADNQVIVAGDQRAPVPAGPKRDENDRRQRRDFKEHEQVEGIARHHQAGQSPAGKQPGGIGLAGVGLNDLGKKRRTGKQRHHEGE